MHSKSEKKNVFISLTDFVKLIFLICVAETRVIDQPTLGIQNFQSPDAQRNRMLSSSPQQSGRLFYDRISEQPQNEFQTASEVQPVSRGAGSMRPLRIRFASGANARLAIRNMSGRRIRLHLGGQSGGRRIRVNFGNSDNGMELPRQREINGLRTSPNMENQNQRFQSTMMRDGLGTSRRRIIVRTSGVGEPRRVIVNTRGGARIHLSTGRKQIVIGRPNMHQPSVSMTAANNRPTNTPLSQQYNNGFNSIQENNGQQTDFFNSQQTLDPYFGGQKTLEVPRKSQQSVDELIRDIVRSISAKRNQMESMTTEAPDVDAEESQ